MKHFGKFLALIILLAMAAIMLFRIQQAHNTASSSQEPPFLDHKGDLIYLESPKPGDQVDSPLTVTGQARGYWFFEASFPVILTDWDGKIITQTYATAQSEWMTEGLVPFQATVEFEAQKYSDYGFLILQKDNPSGLPEHDDALEVQVSFN